MARYKTSTDLLNAIEDLLDEHGVKHGFVAVTKENETSIEGMGNLTVYSDFGPSFDIHITELDGDS